MLTSFLNLARPVGAVQPRHNSGPLDQTTYKPVKRSLRHGADKASLLSKEISNAHAERRDTFSSMARTDLCTGHSSRSNRTVHLPGPAADLPLVKWPRGGQQRVDQPRDDGLVS